MAIMLAALFTEAVQIDSEVDVSCPGGGCGCKGKRSGRNPKSQRYYSEGRLDWLATRAAQVEAYEALNDEEKQLAIAAQRLAILEEWKLCGYTGEIVE